jgi:hypothetical protein
VCDHKLRSGVNWQKAKRQQTRACCTCEFVVLEETLQETSIQIFNDMFFTHDVPMGFPVVDDCMC